MITHIHFYDGAGWPHSSVDVDQVFRMSNTRVITMCPEEEEYLFALQLVHGVELKMYDFFAYHDLVWEHAKELGIDAYLHGVFCTHPDLTELLMSRTGDLRWAKELKLRQQREQHIRLNPYPQGFFI